MTCSWLILLWGHCRQIVTETLCYLLQLSFSMLCKSSQIITTSPSLRVHATSYGKKQLRAQQHNKYKPLAKTFLLLCRQKKRVSDNHDRCQGNRNRRCGCFSLQQTSRNWTWIAKGEQVWLTWVEKGPFGLTLTLLRQNLLSSKLEQLDQESVDQWVYGQDPWQERTRWDWTSVILHLLEAMTFSFRGTNQCSGHWLWQRRRFVEMVKGENWPLGLLWHCRDVGRSVQKQILRNEEQVVGKLTRSESKACPSLPTDYLAGIETKESSAPSFMPLIAPRRISEHSFVILTSSLI